MVIYLFKFPNGKHYVGRTKNTFEQRLAEHKTRVNKQYQHPLYYAFSKYGWDNVEKVILEEVYTHEQAVLAELHYIEYYDSLFNGYNLTINTEVGGDNWQGRRDTPEYVEFLDKMRKLRLGEGNGMYGTKHSKNSKEKMKEKAKGRFTLPWYIERYGEQEGTTKYNLRCQALKNRGLKKDPETGRFAK